MLQSTIAGISLEPHVESPGPCSDTWCAGMIRKMVVELDHNQPPQEIKVVVCILISLYFKNNDS